MKIELILPGWKETSLWNVKAFRFAPLGLATLAALVPQEHEVSITDENATPINFDKDVDLVGISSMTPFAPRAYEIAAEFKKRGKTVVMGGSHASALPDEALQHVDAVVVGEAEGAWQELIEDVKNKRLKKIYKCLDKPSLQNLPFPRRDLLSKKIYFTNNCVQTTRGCPFDCDFCSVSSFYGKTFRKRAIEEVIREIETLDRNVFFFVDDNIVGDPQHAKTLFKALIPHKIKWISQGSITMANDEELLALCAKSGCVSMVIGFESLSQENLKSISKPFNRVEKFKESIKKIHDYGIAIDGIFIFGLEYDDKTVFERTVDFITENKIDIASFTILTPLPGTRLYQKFCLEDRIIERDWTKYDHLHVVFKPNLMSPEELHEGHRWAFRQTYTFSSISRRILGSRTQLLLSIFQNWSFRQATFMLN